MIRHGETAWNAEGRVHGQTDVPLSAVGKAQARALAVALAGERFAALYASDLARVRQTAAPAARTLLEQFPVGDDHDARRHPLPREPDAEIGANARRLAAGDRDQRRIRHYLSSSRYSM